MENWKNSFKAFLHPRVFTMLFFGFSAGIPLLLIFSSLGLWLREAGIERSAVTFFSWAALGYSFKFVWAPIADKLPLPFLTCRLGRRRGWILISQTSIIISILLMASIDPSHGGSYLKLMAIACVMLGFSAATQDIVIDAFRIESASYEFQALMSATYIAGYRIGMLVSGAGSLYIASSLGSEIGSYDYKAWQVTYSCMAAVMLIGIVTTFCINEPEKNSITEYKYSNVIYIKFLLVFILAVVGFIVSFHLSSEFNSSWKDILVEILNNKTFSSFCVESFRLSLGALIFMSIILTFIKFKFIEKKLVVESYVAPVLEFFQRYGVKLAMLLLVLIGLYRISDIVLGVISNIFFQDLGYSKKEIASVVKTFGLLMTILGGFLGGVLSFRFGVMKILFLGGLLTVLSNLLFMLLAVEGYNMQLLYLVISADNLSAGIASAAFVAFLSRLTNTSFTAMQYAIFSSLMSLFPKIIGGYSGSIVENIGYIDFFLFASLLGIPVLGVIYLANKHSKIE